MVIPWIFGLLFLIWYLMARCHFIIQKKFDPTVIQIILNCLTTVLFIGMFKNVVGTCFDMFDCEKTTGRLMLDPRYFCFEANVLIYQIVSAVVFLLWAVIPFTAITIVLRRYKNKGHGELAAHLEEDPLFKIFVGWAIRKYRLEQSEHNHVKIVGLECKRQIILNGLMRGKMSGKFYRRYCYETHSYGI